MDKALLSIVIPAFNHPVELRRAIKSCINQGWNTLEIIVVDDGSSENLANLCNEFADPRILYVRNEVHRNANVARNTGIKLASGEFIAMLDADDEYLPDHLERCLKILLEGNCDGLFGSAFIQDSSGKSIQISRSFREGENMINYLLSDGFAPTPSFFFTAVSAKKIHWDESLERHQDFDYLVRYARDYKLGINYSPTILIHWETHAIKDYKLYSCIEFIKRNEYEINMRNYSVYHRQMYYKIAGFESKKYLRHYAKESYRYVYAMSFAEFLSVHSFKSVTPFFLFIKFIWMHIIKMPNLLKRKNEIQSFNNRFSH